MVFAALLLLYANHLSRSPTNTMFAVFVLQGVTSWFVFYLIKEKGVPDAAQAAMRVSGLELGGLVGSLIAGRLSDMLINKSNGKGGNVGKRVQVSEEMHHCQQHVRWCLCCLVQQRWLQWHAKVSATCALISVSRLGSLHALSNQWRCAATVSADRH